MPTRRAIMSGGLGGILTRVGAAGMRSSALICILMACAMPIGGRMDHPVVPSHAHLSATQTAMPLWGHCATLRTRGSREDAGETRVTQVAFVDGSGGRCLGGNSRMPGTAVMCLRGGGRARRAEEREEAKRARRSRNRESDGDTVMSGKVVKDREKWQKHRDRSDGISEKERMERFERSRKRKADRKAYKEVMEKSKKHKQERKKTKAHCDRMREELDLEYAECKHLFEPYIMKNLKRNVGNEVPDEYDRIYKEIERMPIRPEQEFREGLKRQDERLNLPMDEADLKFRERRKERRDETKREKRAAKREAEEGEEGEWDGDDDDDDDDDDNDSDGGGSDE